MNWNDIGYLISKSRYNENSLIAEVYTEHHGKCSGIIFGATSRKIKNYLQLGNKIYLDHNFKNEGRIGYFKIEILKALAPQYFDDKNKLMCLSSAMNLIKLLTVESQQNIKIFTLIESFFLILKNDDWIKNYVHWELELFKLLGYDLDLQNIVKKETTDDINTYYVEANNEKKIVPSFLVNYKEGNQDLKNLLKGLKLVGDYMEKSILRPNNISYPNTRLDFINSLK